MKIPYTLLAIPTLFFFLRRTKRAPSRMKVPPPDPKKPKSEKQDTTAIFLGQEIGKYIGLTSWAKKSKESLKQAKSLLESDPKQAFALLLSLPEEERDLFCKVIYSEIKGNVRDSAELAGIIGWYYLQFGGTDPDLIAKGQKGVGPFSGLGVPATGVLDEATRDAIERESSLPFWKPVLKHWGLK